MELAEIRNSGMLELYVIGDLSDVEQLQLEESIAMYPELKEEILEIEKALEVYATGHAIPVDPTVKPLMLAGLNYSERLLAGETPVNAPTLNENSKIVDFKIWLDRPDLQEPEAYDSMSGRIITANEEKTTMIVWLKEGAPPETHTDEIEKFLILEGTCDITIGEKVHSLKAGDYLAIPLFISHSVKVTSKMRCKVILERHAA